MSSAPELQDATLHLKEMGLISFYDQVTTEHNVDDAVNIASRFSSFIRENKEVEDLIKSLAKRKLVFQEFFSDYKSFDLPLFIKKSYPLDDDLILNGEIDFNSISNSIDILDHSSIVVYPYTDHPIFGNAKIYALSFSDSKPPYLVAAFYDDKYYFNWDNFTKLETIISND